MNNVWSIASRSAATLSSRSRIQSAYTANRCFTSKGARHSRQATLPRQDSDSQSIPRNPLLWQLACRRSRKFPNASHDFSSTASTSVRGLSKAASSNEARPKSASNPSSSSQSTPPAASSPALDKDVVPGQPFSRGKIREIFASHPQIDTELGNFILATVHLRRKRGSLVELGVRPYNKRKAWTENAGKKALEWLREHHPLDEALAAAVFAENEARRIEEELNIQKALKWGLYKPREGEEAENHVGKAARMAPRKAEEIYGKSMLQEMREKNEARHQKELERMAKEREAVRERERLRRIQKYVDKAQLEGKTVKDLVASGDVKDVVVPRQFLGRDISQYEKDAMIIKSGPPPKMSEFERLFPSTLVTIVTLLGCILFAYSYTPPLREHRLFSSLEPGVATCLAIAAVNVAIFLAWRIPPAWRIMNRYFQLSPGYPFALSILGNAFSHTAASHLAMNMLWMFGVGVHLHDLIGRGNFLALYVGSAAVSSWCSLVFHAATKMLMASTVGASGPVLAIISALLWLREDLGTWRVPFTTKTIDFNGHYVLAALFAVELSYVAAVLSRLTPYKLDHAVHLGGMLTGMAGAIILETRSKVAPGKRIDLNSPFAKRPDED